MEVNSPFIMYVGPEYILFENVRSGKDVLITTTGGEFGSVKLTFREKENLTRGSVRKNAYGVVGVINLLNGNTPNQSIHVLCFRFFRFSF